MLHRRLLFVLCLGLFLLSFLNSCGQNTPTSTVWSERKNITNLMDLDGVIELSGLHWNPLKKRLYAIQDNGGLYVLQFDSNSQQFKKIGYLDKLGGPEGITQVNYNSDEFYTIDEKSYEIRKFTHKSDFSSFRLAHKWSLVSENSAMKNTGNEGPEGIVFIPDNYLKSVGFISSETNNKYLSKKGMGGLIFLAHQKKGYIWVYDINPDKDDDYTFVGKYKTNRNESCDLAFDRSTGLLYILHNIDGNSLEVTDMSINNDHAGKLGFKTIKEYPIPNPKGNKNIEGFAITPKYDDPKHVKVWLCRDVSIDDKAAETRKCLWEFTNFPSEGKCIKDWNYTH